MLTVFEVIGIGAKKYGGLERYILEECRQLKSKNVKLVVIFDSEPLVTQYVRDLESLGADTYVLPINNFWSFIKHFRTLLKKYKPEIVHTNFSRNRYPVQFLSLLYGTRRRISTQHCEPPTGKLYIRIGYQLMAMLVHDILPVSKAATNAILENLFFDHKCVKTLYLGIDEFSFDRDSAREHLGIPMDTIAIMNVAYHNPIKGVDVLLRAMDILVHEYGMRNIKLYQIGGGQTGTDTEYLHKLAEGLRISEYVEWMGLRNDVPLCLCAGDIYVQSSRSEGIPLAIMEASMASLPIVASDVGGIPEAAHEGENAILVESGNPKLLAEALLQLCNDKELRTKLGYQGRHISLENFCLKRQVKKLISDYYHI